MLKGNNLVPSRTSILTAQTAATKLKTSITNTTFPIININMIKVMADFDPAKIVNQFTRAASTFQVPQIEVGSIIAAQRKNIEALTAANKAAVEGVQALVARQNEILQENLKEATEAVNELSKVDGPEDATAKQAELLQASFAKALGNMKDLAELVVQSNTETSTVIMGRILETLEEVKRQAVKNNKKAE